MAGSPVMDVTGRYIGEEVAADALAAADELGWDRPLLMLLCLSMLSEMGISGDLEICC